MQEGILPLLCGSTNVPYEYPLPCSHPVGRTCRDVPFLTGQKGDGKSRRAVRAAADGSAPREAREKDRRKKRKAGKQYRFFPFYVEKSVDRENIYRRRALTQSPTMRSMSASWSGTPES